MWVWVGGLVGWWCVGGVVVVVVVVVLTVKLMTCLWRYVITDAPNYGEPCPCGHDPRPCTCVQGPKKSPHQLINALMSCPS